MKKTLIILSSMFLIIIGAMLVFWFSSEEEEIAEEEQQQTIPLPQPDKAINQETDSYIIKAVYPVTGNAFVDNDIVGIINQEIDDFKALPGIDEVISENWKNGLDISYFTSQHSDTIKSFQFNISTFTGGAHPNLGIVTRTYNFENNRIITLSDFFKPDSDYLSYLSQTAREKLAQSLYETEWSEDSEDFSLSMLKSGTIPDFENFKNFRLAPDSLIIVFAPYQVGPYVLGSPELELKLEDLKEFLR